jgi:uncharacterized protein YbcI
METEERSSPAAAISTATVQIFRRRAGRGPVKARTHISGDLVSVVLGDTLTRAEQTLVENGEWQHVEALRLRMQGIMKDEMVAAVEKQMGRKVVAFASANHCNPDLAFENFLLASK